MNVAERLGVVEARLNELQEEHKRQRIEILHLKTTVFNLRLLMESQGVQTYG